MSGRDVLDVRRGNHIHPVADQSQATALCPLNKSWHELCVARAPNQMRPQRAGREFRPVCCDHCLLGQSLAVRIVRQEFLRVRQRLVSVDMVMPVENHARRTRVYQFPDAVFPATSDNIGGTERVDSVEELPRPPDSGHCRNVEGNIHAVAGRLDNRCVLKVSLNPVDTRLVQPFMPVSAQYADVDAVIE